MKRVRRAESNGLRFVVLFTFALFFLLMASSFVDRPKAEVNDKFEFATPRKTVRLAAPKRKYSEFPHSVKAHQISCNTCHKFPSDNWEKVRAKDQAFPDVTEYPKHESCVSCHRQQFFRGNPPVICSICHTNPSPRDSTRHPFPNPRETFDLSAKGKTATSDFMISFPHATHVDIVSKNRNSDVGFRTVAWSRSRPVAEESCAVCHKTYQPQGDGKDEYVSPPPEKWGDKFWLKKGTFKSVPTGHTTCFTCHSADSGMTPAPTDCATCHKLKTPIVKADFDPAMAASMKMTDTLTLDAWRLRDSSATFRHEWSSHSELSCSTCHDAAKIVTTDSATKKVSMLACATCHATATADDGGALNFEVDSRKSNPKFECSKCHLSYGKLPIPDSHLKAIAAAAGK